MDIREAALIHEAGKEMVVKNLLELHARIESLSRQVITPERKITALSTNYTNSSKPPPSDGPKVAKPKKKKSRRSPGGRKGHKGHRRELFPVEERDKVHEHFPPVCGKCGASPGPGEMRGDSRFLKIPN